MNGDGQGKHILVVDDEPFFREEVVEFLTQPRLVASRGWTVDAADGGEDAIRKIEERPEGVVLLDINMPGMDGMEVLDQLRKQHLLDRACVIMLSAYGVYENVVESMRRGAKDFVNKSEPLDQWVVRIDRGFEWLDLQRRRRQLEEELRMLAKEVGHDIGGSSYMVLTQRVRALEKLVADNEQGQRSIEVISGILARIKRLADDLGHITVALDPTEIWRWEQLDLRRLMERLLQEFAYAHPEVDIVREYAGDLPPVLGSRAQLERVFYNLLTNAGRAMPDGGQLTVRLRRDGETGVAVEIADTGIGITERALERMFQIGFTDWRNGQKGSGLGLYVSRKNVENHGGAISVRSEAGVGTTFTVRLPERPPSAES